MNFEAYNLIRACDGKEAAELLAFAFEEEFTTK